NDQNIDGQSNSDSSVGGAALFVADPAGNAIASWIHGNSGWTQVGSYATGKNPIAVRVDPSSRFVFTLNRDDGTLSNFRINFGTEELSLVGTTGIGSNPSALAVGPQSIYVGSDAGIGEFSFNPATGAVASIGTVATGNPVAAIA